MVSTQKLGKHVKGDGYRGNQRGLGGGRAIS